MLALTPAAAGPTHRFMRHIPTFALASLIPFGLLAAGFAGHGAALVLALVYMTLFVAVADQVLPLLADDAEQGTEFPAADALLATIGFGALGILPWGVHALITSAALGWPAAACGALALGLWLGQVAVPAAHELIHRGEYRFVRLGVAVYVALLFGHHASAHRLVHHRHVATPADPNTAAAGEGYYTYVRRAWIGSFRAGHAAEARLRKDRRGPQGWSGPFAPYAVYIAGCVLALGVAFALAGIAGVALWAVLAVHAQAQLLLSDYVQHYGLERTDPDTGAVAPQSAAHSWNAAQWLSGRMMLNAARHSDHHVNPARAFPTLRLIDGAPMLPWSLPMACTIALLPPVWCRLMAPHLARARNAASLAKA